MKIYQENLELAKINIKNLDYISQNLKKRQNSITLLNSKFEDLNYNLYQQINYNFNNNNMIIEKIYKLLLYSFISMRSLISKPIFEITSKKVIIHLFYYSFLNLNNLRKNKKIRNKLRTNEKFKENIIITYENKLEILCKILEKIFKKPVELDLVRLHYPYFDTNIFIYILNKIINKIKIRKRIKKFIKKSKAAIINPIKYKKLNKNFKYNLFTFISGFNIKIGGRLLTDRIVPRKTLLTLRKGTLTRNKFNFLDQARFISKNKRGSYSISINISKFFK